MQCNDPHESFAAAVTAQATDLGEAARLFAALAGAPSAPTELCRCARLNAAVLHISTAGAAVECAVAVEVLAAEARCSTPPAAAAQRHIARVAARNLRVARRLQQLRAEGSPDTPGSPAECLELFFMVTAPPPHPAAVLPAAGSTAPVPRPPSAPRSRSVAVEECGAGPGGAQYRVHGWRGGAPPRIPFVNLLPWHRDGVLAAPPGAAALGQVLADPGRGALPTVRRLLRAVVALRAAGWCLAKGALHACVVDQGRLLWPPLFVEHSEVSAAADTAAVVSLLVSAAKKHADAPTAGRLREIAAAVAAGPLDEELLDSPLVAGDPSPDCGPAALCRAFFQAALGGDPLRVRVDRGCLVAELSYWWTTLDAGDVLRPVQAQFAGEPAIDGGHGGVASELFSEFVARAVAALRDAPDSLPAVVAQALGCTLCKCAVDDRALHIDLPRALAGLCVADRALPEPELWAAAAALDPPLAARLRLFAALPDAAVWDVFGPDGEVVTNSTRAAYVAAQLRAAVVGRRAAALQCVREGFAACTQALPPAVAAALRQEGVALALMSSTDGLTAGQVTACLEFRGWGDSDETPVALCEWLHDQRAPRLRGFLRLCTGLQAVPGQGRIVVERCPERFHAQTCFMHLFLPPLPRRALREAIDVAVAVTESAPEMAEDPTIGPDPTLVP